MPVSGNDDSDHRKERGYDCIDRKQVFQIGGVYNDAPHFIEMEMKEFPDTSPAGKQWNQRNVAV